MTLEEAAIILNRHGYSGLTNWKVSYDCLEAGPNLERDLFHADALFIAEALIALSKPIARTWSWALEMMKAGKTVTGGNFVIGLKLNSEGEIILEKTEELPGFEISDFEATNWTVVEKLTWMHGKHSLTSDKSA